MMMSEITKCLRCEKVFISEPTDGKNYSHYAQTEDVVRGTLSFMRATHHCEDGGLGVEVFVGFEKTDV